MSSADSPTQNNSHKEPHDTVIRAMTDDDSFRVMVALTTSSVQQVMKRQSPPLALIENLGELLTGTVLVRETMSPGERVQGILRGANNRGTLVADSQPDGTMRGLCNLPEGMQHIDWKPGAVLMMMRSLPGGKVHQGVVGIDKAKSISEALMLYMHESEQITTMIDVACDTRDDGQVLVSGGYVMQLLPELSDSKLAIMTERLSDFPSMKELLAKGSTPEHVLDELLYAMPYTKLGKSPLRFACNCSEFRVLASLSTLDRSDLQQLIQGPEVLEIDCDFCGKHYAISPEKLRGLLTQS